MSYYIATYVIPMIVGLIFIFIFYKKMNISWSTIFLLFFLFFSFYSYFLYTLDMENIWDTNWAYYSVGFIAILYLLIGLILLIIQKMKSFK